jgi:hypothetical protein
MRNGEALPVRAGIAILTAPRGRACFDRRESAKSGNDRMKYRTHCAYLAGFAWSSRGSVHLLIDKQGSRHFAMDVFK